MLFCCVYFVLSCELLFVLNLVLHLQVSQLFTSSSSCFSLTNYSLFLEFNVLVLLYHFLEKNNYGNKVVPLSTQLKMD